MNIPNIQITPVSGQIDGGANSFSSENENGALFTELMESQMGNGDLENSELIMEEEKEETSDLGINLGVLTLLQPHSYQQKEVESEKDLSPTNSLELISNSEVSESSSAETKLISNNVIQLENLENYETTSKENFEFKGNTFDYLKQVSAIANQYSLAEELESKVLAELNLPPQTMEGNKVSERVLSTLVPTEISKELEVVFGDSLKKSDGLVLDSKEVVEMPLLGTEFETLKVVNVRKIDDAVIPLVQTTVDEEVTLGTLNEKTVEIQPNPEELTSNFNLPTTLNHQQIEVGSPVQGMTVEWENKVEFEELMVKQASLMKDGDTTNLVIKLKPYSLGEMKISLEFKDGQLRGLIQLEKEEAKKVVEESLKMLQGEIKNSIIEVEQMGTTFRDGDSFKEDSQRREYSEDEQKQRHSSEEENLFEEVLREMSSSGLELRV